MRGVRKREGPMLLDTETCAESNSTFGTPALSKHSSISPALSMHSGISVDAVSHIIHAPSVYLFNPPDQNFRSQLCNTFGYKLVDFFVFFIIFNYCYSQGDDEIYYGRIREFNDIQNPVSHIDTLPDGNCGYYILWLLK